MVENPERIVTISFFVTFWFQGTLKMAKTCFVQFCHYSFVKIVSFHEPLSSPKWSKFKVQDVHMVTKLLNPKQKKAKLLGWALLSQNPTLLLLSTTYTEVSHLLPKPTEKNQLLGPNKRYWSEILGISSTSLNLIFELVLFNLIGSSK